MQPGGNPMGTVNETGNWAEIAAAVLAALAMVGAAIMRFAGIERTIEQKTNEIRQDLTGKLDDGLRAFGDTGSALRQKTTDVEIWARDTFVRRDEFTQAIHQVNRNIDALRNSTETSMKTFDEKLDRLDSKIDAKLDKLLSRGNGS
jgi:hypothetical protein